MGTVQPNRRSFDSKWRNCMKIVIYLSLVHVQSVSVDTTVEELTEKERKYYLKKKSWKMARYREAPENSGKSTRNRRNFAKQLRLAQMSETESPIRKRAENCSTLVSQLNIPGWPT